MPAEHTYTFIFDYLAKILNRMLRNIILKNNLVIVTDKFLAQKLF